jgi:hypothetical protein
MVAISATVMAQWLDSDRSRMAWKRQWPDLDGDSHGHLRFYFVPIHAGGDIKRGFK